MARVRDLLAQRSSDAFVGRSRELDVLLATLQAAGPLVIYVHGIGGIGKSTLLEAFCTRARRSRATVVRLDCRTVEPTERGLMREVSRAVGASGQTLAKVASRLRRLGTRVVIVLDTYEVFGLMDTWLRQEFIPALPDNVRVIVAGRQPPVPAWHTGPGWQGLFRALPVDVLRDADALDMLQQLGIDEIDARRVNRFAGGHPLALRLAASTLRERRDLNLEERTIPHVVEALTRTYLADVPDPLTRQVLEAASCVRRTTQSVLHAMLPSVAPQDAFERLHALPFVDRRRDGLIVHDSIKRVVAHALHTSDPERQRLYRRAAWQHFRAELRTASAADLWRSTADVLYLIQNPAVRDAFFPEEGHGYAVEPARDDDAAAIRAIVGRHEGPEGARAMEAWLTRLPRSFSVVRNASGVVVGFYAMAEPKAIGVNILATDPIARTWLGYLQRDPVGRHERVLLLRRWMSAEQGELPSTVQAACWLDIKRTYLALRPSLRRIVTTVRDLPTWAPIVTQLGFRPLDFTIDLDGMPNVSAVLDFGTESVDGWLAALLAAELGIAPQPRLDEASGELILDDRRVALTPREFEVLRYLSDRPGQVIDRGTLLEEIWGADYDGGSNVVDVVVRGLRAKLATRAAMIETLRGRGYRVRSD